MITRNFQLDPKDLEQKSCDCETTEFLTEEQCELPKGETIITEYIVAAEDDPLQQNAAIISGCTFKDMREVEPSKLPKSISDFYKIYEMKRTSDRKFIQSKFLGTLYQTTDGMVLSNPIPLGTRKLLFFLAGCAPATPTPPPPCPTTKVLTGSGTAYVGHYNTRAAATAAAVAAVPGRARTDAGLARNGHSCPNPTCTNKTLGLVTSTLTGSGSSLSLIASAFWFSWKYEGWATYTWSATVTCS